SVSLASRGFAPAPHAEEASTMPGSVPPTSPKSKAFPNDPTPPAVAFARWEGFSPPKDAGRSLSQQWVTGVFPVGTTMADEIFTEGGFLVLADISGFTAFVTATELEHGAQVTGVLLETVMGQLSPPLEIQELEGDAVFALGPDRILS